MKCEGEKGFKHEPIMFTAGRCPLCAEHAVVIKLRKALQSYWDNDSCDYEHGPPADQDNAYFDDGEPCDCRAHQAWWALCQSLPAGTVKEEG